MVLRYSLLPLFLVLSWFSFRELDNRSLDMQSDSSNPKFMPTLQSVQFMSLGQQEAVAGVLWVDCLISMGDAYYDHRDFLWLSYMSRLVTDLDDHFYVPYYFVGSISTDSHDTNAVSVLKKGVDIFPKDWKLALYYSLLITKNDNPRYAEAAQLMNRFSHADSVPEHIRHIGHTFEINTQPTDIAFALLMDDYLNPAYQSFRYGIILKILDRLGKPKSLHTQAGMLISRFGNGEISASQLKLSLSNL